MFFDAKEFHTSNKEVANILSSTSAQPTEQNATSRAAAAASLDVGNANWGDEDELVIDADAMIDKNGGEVDDTL